MSEPREPQETIDEDRMLDLLHGLLPREERREALERLARDPEVERAFRMRARGLERARSRGVPAVREEPVSLRGRILAAIRSPSPPALIGFGAAVAVAVALFRLPAVPGPDAFHPLPSGTEALRLRSADSVPDDVLRGLDAYAAGEWERAAQLLAAASGGGASDLVRRIYLGSSLAMAGRADEATEALDGLPLDLLPEPWGAETRWTRALALRRAGREDEAAAELEALAAGPGAVGDRARALLGK